MSKDGYTEIKIGKKVEFEQDADNQSKEIEINIDDIETNTEVVAEPKVEAVVEAPVVKPEKPKESRAQKRIQQLHKEKNDALALLEQANKEKADLQKLIYNDSQSSKTTLKATLENQIKLLTSQMVEAMKSGDSETVVELQNSLMDAKMQLTGISYELNNAKEPVAQRESPKEDKISEKALSWIDDHPEFKSDEEFYTAAIVNNNKLIREGYDVNSDEFYAELDKRLAKRFPEVFGIPAKNSVNLKQDQKSGTSVDDGDDNEHTDAKEQVVEKPSKARTTEQTVSGSSRPSSTTIQQKSTKNTVTLSPVDIAQAERWGLSLEQMARRIAHTERTKDANGYSPIFIQK